MTVLSNARHERFAQELAKGKTATEAYELAGYAPNDGNCIRLKGNERISARVAELQGAVAEAVVERVAVSKQWVIDRLVENADRAMQAAAVKDDDGNAIGQYQYQGNVANRALELIGKEMGMFIDRKEVGQPGAFDKMTDQEVLDALSSEASQIGLSVPKIKGNGRGNGNGTAH